MLDNDCRSVIRESQQILQINRSGEMTSSDCFGPKGIQQSVVFHFLEKPCVSYFF